MGSLADIEDPGLARGGDRQPSFGGVETRLLEYLARQVAPQAAFGLEGRELLQEFVGVVIADEGGLLSASFHLEPTVAIAGRARAAIREGDGLCGRRQLESLQLIRLNVQ